MNRPRVEEALFQGHVNSPEIVFKMYVLIISKYFLLGIFVIMLGWGWGLEI